MDRHNSTRSSRFHAQYARISWTLVLRYYILKLVLHSCVSRVTTIDNPQSQIDSNCVSDYLTVPGGTNVSWLHFDEDMSMTSTINALD